MIDCWNLLKFGKDLSDFVKLLKDFEVPVELIELSNLDSKMQYETNFKVDIQNIVFNIDKKISGTIPVGIELITVTFSNCYELDSTKDLLLQDPVKDYNFQMQIKGYDNNAKEYIFWWHLDKNIESAPPKFTHPYYHFQSGGNDLELKDSGEIILLGAPRLPHPPMDLFLGIHFIINNFLSSKDYPQILVLFKNYEYQEIIKTAQKRMWEPYFNGFGLGNINSDFTFQNIFPLFVQ